MGGLVYDGSQSFGSHDRPDEERDSGGGSYVGFHCEEVAERVHREPEEGQRAEPEEEERDEEAGACSCGFGDGVFAATCSVVVP